ncbi:MAG: TatD family hydrolase [Christensenellaceae bacterium]
MFIDIHAHLTDKKYAKSIREIVGESQNAGVGIIVDSGYSVETSKQAEINAVAHDGVYFVCGIHPEKQAEYDKSCENTLRKLAVNKKCLAIGEIGLDYHYENYDKKAQQEVFIRQIELASELNLPFVVHSRDASGDVYDILSAHKSLINHGFLLHCYSESREMVKRYADLGAYFSFGGVITFKNAKKDEIIRSVPIDRLLTETDSPYLSPVPFRGEINSPKNVVPVYEKLCQILGCDLDFLKEKVYSNAVSLFEKLKT